MSTLSRMMRRLVRQQQLRRYHRGIDGVHALRRHLAAHVVEDGFEIGD
jgi:hypothetical protein